MNDSVVLRMAQSIPGVCSLCAVESSRAKGSPGSLHWCKESGIPEEDDAGCQE